MLSILSGCFVCLLGFFCLYVDLGCLFSVCICGGKSGRVGGALSFGDKAETRFGGWVVG